jgi:hypothetical protein
MPAANQFLLATLRISSTGVAQEDAGGGAGDSTSSMVKSPFSARGTPTIEFVLRSINGATFSQMSVAKTLITAAPPEPAVPTAVPIVASGEHEASPVGLDVPVELHLGLKIGDPPYLVGRRDSANNVQVTAVALTVETGMAPIPPSNLTNTPSATADSGASATPASNSKDGIFMRHLLTVRMRTRRFVSPR